MTRRATEKVLWSSLESYRTGIEMGQPNETASKLCTEILVLQWGILHGLISTIFVKEARHCPLPSHKVALQRCSTAEKRFKDSLQRREETKTE